MLEPSAYEATAGTVTFPVSPEPRTCSFAYEPYGTATFWPAATALLFEPSLPLVNPHPPTKPRLRRP
jgi:hypothetical protein